MEPKRAPPARAPLIHLTSTAAYVRPTLGATGIHIPLESTYRTSYGAPAEDMERRCIAARRETKSVNMIVSAAATIPLDLVDAMEARVNEDFAKAAAETIKAQQLAVTVIAERAVPTPTAAETAFTATLAALPRHPVSGALKRDLFTGGADGSVSVKGDADASRYYELVKGAAGGRFLFTKADRIAPNGELLKNHAKL